MFEVTLIGIIVWLIIDRIRTARILLRQIEEVRSAFRAYHADVEQATQAIGKKVKVIDDIFNGNARKK